MAALLLADPDGGVVESFAETIRRSTDHDVTVVHRLDDVGEAVRSVPVDLALVSLVFPYDEVPNDRGSGLDALVEIRAAVPSARLAIHTSVDRGAWSIQRDVEELIPIVAVIPRTASLDAQIDAIDRIARTGRPPQSCAPGRSGPAHRRTFANLVPHLGHARLWEAVMTSGPEPTYQRVAERAGLTLNTVKNYRAALLGELRMHGLERPGLSEMRDFGLRCRPFLRPHIDAAMSRRPPERESA